MPLRWFRFGKKEEEAAAQEAAAREEETPPEVVEAQQAPEVVGSEDAPGAAKKKRRRGSRGGRGRKKPGTTTDVAADAVAAPGQPEAPAQGKSERKPGERKTGRTPAERKSQRATRRRTPTRRAPLPAAKRELLISVDVGEQRVAVLEDDRVAEVYLERPERRSIAGNIYLGVVDNVLPGMEAAFVEIGLEKNGFLYVDEIVGPELEGRKGARKIQDLIKRGQNVLVQAVKDPMKSKGARLTTELSLPGRFLVYVPYGEGMGVSRRLDDQERTRLKEIVRELDAKGGGIIVRTAAEGASAEDIERDLVFLQRLWKTIQAKAEKADCARARLRGGRAPAAHRARSLRRRLRRGSDRRRPHPPQDRQLPEEDLAAHDRARSPVSGEDAALRVLGSRAGDSLHARPQGRPALGRIPRLRLRGGVHRHRRQHRPLRRLARQVRGRQARRHDREEQPRGREGGRAPASAARHRRDHRHRLHRHGEPEEPLDGGGRSAQRARARPHEDRTSSRSPRSDWSR